LIGLNYFIQIIEIVKITLLS